jgi:hypothetical protein
MNAKKLNMGKAVWLLVILAALVLFTISMKNGNGLILSLVVSILASLPAAWVVGAVLTAIYEILKLLKPAVDWFFK